MYSSEITRFYKQILREGVRDLDPVAFLEVPCPNLPATSSETNVDVDVITEGRYIVMCMFSETAIKLERATFYGLQDLDDSQAFAALAQLQPRLDTIHMVNLNKKREQAEVRILLSRIRQTQSLLYFLWRGESRLFMWLIHVDCACPHRRKACVVLFAGFLFVPFIILRLFFACN